MPFNPLTLGNLAAENRCSNTVLVPTDDEEEEELCIQ